MRRSVCLIGHASAETGAPLHRLSRLLWTAQRDRTSLKVSVGYLVLDQVKENVKG